MDGKIKDKKRCPKCGFISENPDIKFCEICGYQFEKPENGNIICFACKAIIPKDSNVCPFCGVKVKGTKISQPVLISFGDNGEKNEHILLLPKSTIGRNPKCTIPFIGEKSISSEHCLIFYKNGKFFIRDLNSTNGVYLNNKKIEESEIKDGDIIKLGLKKLKFKIKTPQEV